MKLNFSPQQDGRVHSHCVRCQAEAVVKRAQRYHCNQCGHVDDRAIIIDPEVTWWLQEGVYYHSTAGVFLRNPEGKLLFFERVKFPFGLTVPAGHVSPAESDQETALRETFEETTIRLRRDQLMPLFSEMIHQDSCPRGADSHQWQTYLAELPRGARARINPLEGKNPVWLTPSEALRRPLILPVRYLVQRYMIGSSSD